MLLVIATLLCTLISTLACVVQGGTAIQVKSGQNTTLDCPCLQNKTVAFLRFIELEFQSQVYVRFHLQSNKTYQDSSFKGRVELKDGALMFILKTVSIRDAGIYNCWVIFKNEGISGTQPPCRHCFNLTVTAAEQKNITAGQTVVLPCRAPNDNNEPNTGVKWSRPDLEPQNVLLYLLYLNQKSHPDYQHPSFKNRVDLQDRQMKDGDVSLILKDVTINDTGTYECWVFVNKTRSWKFINSTSLRVVGPPDQPGGTIEEEEAYRRMKDRLKRLVVGLCIFGVFLGVVGFLIHRRHKEQNQDSSQPPAEQQQIQMLQLNHESPAPLPSDLSTDTT